MKLPAFTLVHNMNRRSSAKDAEALSELRTAKKSLRESIGASFSNGVLNKSAVNRVAKEINRQPNVHTVGILDLGAWVGALPKIIERMKKAQPDIVIFEIQAAIPSGLVQDADRVAFRAEEILGRKLKRSERAELQDAIVDVDFFPLGERVRREVGVDYLIALTGDRIAGEISDDDGHTFHSDFFSSPQDHVCLVSTNGLRELAIAAKRPFEMAVGYVFLGSLLVAMNPGVTFHDDAGCLFDYNYDRTKITKGLASPIVDEKCLGKIKPRYRSMTRHLLESLSSYRRSDQIGTTVGSAS
jgi:hypothetical protein